MRGEILKDAYNVVNGVKLDQYGDPEDSFAAIAAYWTAYFQTAGLAIAVSGKDVAMLMVLLKIAREQHLEKMDNLVDAAGYISLAYDLGQRRDEDNQSPKIM